MAVNDDTKPFDTLVCMVEAYDALAVLAQDRHGSDDPVLVLLCVLNRHLRYFVNYADDLGLVS
jgi:hypothetical protein